MSVICLEYRDKPARLVWRIASFDMMMCVMKSHNHTHFGRIVALRRGAISLLRRIALALLVVVLTVVTTVLVVWVIRHDGIIERSAM